VSSACVNIECCHLGPVNAQTNLSFHKKVADSEKFSKKGTDCDLIGRCGWALTDENVCVPVERADWPTNKPFFIFVSASITRMLTHEQTHVCVSPNSFFWSPNAQTDPRTNHVYTPGIGAFGHSDWSRSICLCLSLDVSLCVSLSTSLISLYFSLYFTLSLEGGESKHSVDAIYIGGEESESTRSTLYMYIIYMYICI
jgi:hypothetical protein